MHTEPFLTAVLEGGTPLQARTRKSYRTSNHLPRLTAALGHGRVSVAESDVGVGELCSTLISAGPSGELVRPTCSMILHQQQPNEALLATILEY